MREIARNSEKKIEMITVVSFNCCLKEINSFIRLSFLICLLSNSFKRFSFLFLVSNISFKCSQIKWLFLFPARILERKKKRKKERRKKSYKKDWKFWYFERSTWRDVTARIIICIIHFLFQNFLTGEKHITNKTNTKRFFLKRFCLKR